MLVTCVDDNCILEVSQQYGVVLSCIQSNRDGSQWFNHPRNATVLPSGGVIIADTDNDTVRVLDIPGCMDTNWEGVPNPIAVVQVGDVVVVALKHLLTSLKSLIAFNQTLNKRVEFGEVGAHIIKPTSMCVIKDSSNIAVTDGASTTTFIFSILPWDQCGQCIQQIQFGDSFTRVLVASPTPTEVVLVDVEFECVYVWNLATYERRSFFRVPKIRSACVVGNTLFALCGDETPGTMNLLSFGGNMAFQTRAAPLYGELVDAFRLNTTISDSANAICANEHIQHISVATVATVGDQTAEMIHTYNMSTGDRKHTLTWLDPLESSIPRSELSDELKLATRGVRVMPGQLVQKGVKTYVACKNTGVIWECIAGNLSRYEMIYNADTPPKVMPICGLICPKHKKKPIMFTADGRIALDSDKRETDIIMTLYAPGGSQSLTSGCMLPNGAEFAVVDNKHNVVRLYDVFSFKYIRSIGQGVLCQPRGVACTQYNDFVIADTGNSCLRVFSYAGELKRTFGCGVFTGVYIDKDFIVAHKDDTTQTRPMCFIFSAPQQPLC